MEIQRLNMDSSWAFHWQGLSAIVDPWLVDSEIDGFKWLNEQWHIKDPVQIDQLPATDFLLISQSYSDHCHFQTLDLLPQNAPIIATPKAYKKLQKKYPSRKIDLIPNFTEAPLEIGGLRFWHFHPGKKMDPVYFGVFMVDDNDQGIFYTPHGFELNQAQKTFLRGININLLITTFTDFELPGIMGGRVNPGMDNVRHLLADLQPQFVLNTHDEPKKMKGLVSRLGKVKYPNWEAVQSELGPQFIATPDYQTIKIPTPQENQPS